MPRLDDLQRAVIAVLLAFGVLVYAAGCTKDGPGVTDSVRPKASRGKKAGPAGKSFDLFCASWMQKLNQRSERNAKKIAYRKTGGRIVGEYVGYSSKPVRCSVKETGVPANPFVGKLVYYEVRYRKAGETRAAARKSRPKPLERIEVLELFRFNGKRWIY
jgi:hypothetical protein